MSAQRKTSDTTARLFGLSTASTKSDATAPSIRTDGVPSDLLPSVPLEAAPPPEGRGAREAERGAARSAA